MSATIENAILKILEDKGPLYLEEIQKKLKTNSKYSYNVIRSLVHQGRITKINSKYAAGPVGRYLVPPADPKDREFTIPLPITPVTLACFYARSQTPVEALNIEQMREDAIRGVELYAYYLNVTRDYAPTEEQADMAKVDNAVAKTRLQEIITPYIKQNQNAAS